MDGFEFALWRGVVEGPFRYGQLELTVEHIDRLQRLSKLVVAGSCSIAAKMSPSYRSLAG